MPAVFDKLGVRFEYPDSWEIDEEEARSSGDTITVYSPGGAFWSLNLQSPGLDADELALTAVDAMREEFEQLDAERVTETIDGVELSGYNMNFYCLDLTNTACVRIVEREHATYLVIYQAEDREFKDISPVFDAITVSLMR